MLISSFTVDVAQKILAILVSGQRLNDWSPKAYAQGFSWRPQSVSFLTFDDGNVLTEVHLEQKISLKKNAIRAIVVPFQVSNKGAVEVFGIFQRKGETVAIRKGKYALVFQLGYTGNLTHPAPDINVKEMWCRLGFILSDDASARILKQDDDLNPPNELVMDGKPV
jgi:hypothetical protein